MLSVVRKSLLVAMLVAIAAVPAASAWSIRVSAFFARGEASCGKAFAVARSAEGPAVLRNAVVQILAGPTAAERRRGFRAWSPRTSGEMLGSVRLEAGIAHVDLAYVPQASRCERRQLRTALDRTLGQFSAVEQTLYTLDGSATDFDRWLAFGVAFPPPANTHTFRVSLFFPQGDAGRNCRSVQAVSRVVSGPAFLHETLERLVSGPVVDERKQGYGGWFSSRTRGALRGVILRDGVAEIDFRDLRRLIPNASSSCGSALLLAQLNRTVFQFPNVRHVSYSINGSQRAFLRWLQR
jgi:hypothetical protein